MVNGMMVKWLLLGFLLRGRSRPSTKNTPLFFYFSEEQGRTREGKWRGERGKKARGRGTRSFVCGPAGVLGQLVWPRCRVVCGMLRCLTSRVETYHANTLTITTKKPQDTPCTCRGTTVQERRLPVRMFYANPLERFWKISCTTFLIRRYLDVVVTSDIWNFSALRQCSLNECHKYRPASSYNGSLYKAFSYLLKRATSCW